MSKITTWISKQLPFLKKPREKQEAPSYLGYIYWFRFCQKDITRGTSLVEKLSPWENVKMESMTCELITSIMVKPVEYLSPQYYAAERLLNDYIWIYRHDWKDYPPLPKYISELYQSAPDEEGVYSLFFLPST